MYIIIRQQRLKRPPRLPLKIEQVTRRLLGLLDEVVSDSPRIRLLQQIPDSAQATMQVTSTFVLKSIASDQSLAQSPTKANNVQRNSMASDPASDQKNYMEFYNK